MKMSFIRRWIAAPVLFALMAAPAAAQSYAVIVHAENAFDGDETAIVQQLRRLYLKEQGSWPGGEDAIPFSREADSSEQQAFLSSVVGMTPAEEEDHWLRLKQIRGETEPRAVGSSRILARQVARNPGAFAVVEADEVEGMEGVRVLYTFDAS